MVKKKSNISHNNSNTLKNRQKRFLLSHILPFLFHNMEAIGELHLQGFQTPSHKLPQVLFLHFLKSHFAYLLPTLIAPGIYTHTHFALSKKTHAHLLSILWYLFLHTDCSYQACVCFIHCHFCSFTISEEIRRLMHVEHGYLILLSPVGLFVSCQ